MKHIPAPWELSPSGLQIRKDTKGDGTLVICNMSASNYIMYKTRIANALRIVECVNAMEGIENPKLLRKYWDEQMFNEVKSNYVKTMLLSKEELQKLGEQYANQEETPYVETTTGEKVRQKHTAAAKKYIGLTIKRNEQDQPKDVPTKADIDELLSYASKYEELKEVIENMVARIDEGGELTLTKDSIIVHYLKESLK